METSGGREPQGDVSDVPRGRPDDAETKEWENHQHGVQLRYNRIGYAVALCSVECGNCRTYENTCSRTRPGLYSREDNRAGPNRYAAGDGQGTSGSQT